MTGETATPEAAVLDAGDRDVEEAEELLVEEISIDGMCGVY
jgi:mycofactocin precursor